MRLTITLLAVILIALGLLPLPDDPARAALEAAFPAGPCVHTQPVDPGRTLEEIRQAHAWNALLVGTGLATPERGGVYSPQAVLDQVETWLPLIGCLAQEFDIPPALLAGTVAAELDVDYHWTDLAVDSAMRTGTVGGGIISYLVTGGGFASVHTSHLRPALRLLDKDFSQSPFYRGYYRIVMSYDFPAFTRLTTSSRLVDLANGSVMARHYAGLRMGNRPLKRLSAVDMAFVWAAYRGGVSNTAADPDDGYRWSLETLRTVSNPHLFGDTIIALPYFSYYRLRFPDNSQG